MNFKFKRKLNLFFKLLISTISIYTIFQFSLNNQKVFAQNDGNCVAYLDNEIDEKTVGNGDERSRLDDFFEKFVVQHGGKNFDVPIIIIGTSGMNALDDIYKQDGTNRKMNDFVPILASEISKYLNHKKFILVLVNEPDHTIPEAQKHEFDFTILPNIPTVNSLGQYDHFYSATNQVRAVENFANRICEERGFAREEVEVVKENKNVKDDPANENSDDEKKPKTETFFNFPNENPYCAFISLQVNSCNNHNNEGMVNFYYPGDKFGKEISESILKICKNIISKESKATEESSVLESKTKTIPQIGKHGLATSLVFVDYCDNKKIQNKLFDKDTIRRMAMNIANSIEHVFKTNPIYAGISLKHLIENGQNNVFIKINLTGENTDELKKIVVDISQHVNTTNSFKKEIPVEHNAEGNVAYLKFKFPENKNLKDENSKFYLSIFNCVENEKDKDSENKANNQNNQTDDENNKENKKLIPISSNITNFKVEFENELIKIKPNEF